MQTSSASPATVCSVVHTGKRAVTVRAPTDDLEVHDISASSCDLSLYRSWTLQCPRTEYVRKWLNLLTCAKHAQFFTRETATTI